LRISGVRFITQIMLLLLFSCRTLTAPVLTTPLIATQCAGRFGNQLFQFASAVILSNLSSGMPCLDCDKCDSQEMSGKCYSASHKCSLDERSGKCYSASWSMFEYVPKVCGELQKAHIIDKFKARREVGHHIFSPHMIQPLLPAERRGVKLWGFMQSWKYFSGYETLIREKLLMRHKVVSHAQAHLRNLADGLQDLVYIGVHVRRGDQAVSRNILPSTPFFEKAFSYYRKLFVNRVMFVVVSDNPSWCKDQRVFGGNDTRVIEGTDQTGSALQEFAMLSLCNHSIITIGTFGWWSAWLAGGNVIYNSEFNLKHHRNRGRVKLKDYYPLSWKTFS